MISQEIFLSSMILIIENLLPYITIDRHIKYISLFELISSSSVIQTFQPSTHSSFLD